MREWLEVCRKISGNLFESEVYLGQPSICPARLHHLLAGLRKLLRDGTLKEEDSAVVLVTGSGLKEPDKVAKMYEERHQGRKKKGPSLQSKGSVTRADAADRI